MIEMKVRAHDRVARRSGGEQGVEGGTCDEVWRGKRSAPMSDSGQPCVVLMVVMNTVVHMMFV